MSNVKLKYYSLHKHLSPEERIQIDSWPIPNDYQVEEVKKMFYDKYQNCTISDIMSPAFAMWAKLFIKCYETRPEDFI